MKCEKVREILSLYIDNKLSPKSVKEIENHLNRCEFCMKEYEELLKVKKLLAHIPEVELPYGFKEDLHEKLVQCSLEQEKEMEIIQHKNEYKEKSKHLRKFNWRILSGIAAVILMMVVSIFLLDNLPKVQNQELARNKASESEEGSYGIASEPASHAPKFYDTGKGAKPEINEAQMNRADTNFTIAKDEAAMEEKLTPDDGRKVILQGYINLDIEEYDVVHDKIIDLTISKGGFIQSSHTRYKHYNKEQLEKSLRAGNLVIRIPERDFYKVFNEIKKMGTVVNQSINSNDITEQYRDTVSEIENLKIQEKRLREIMDKAENVKEILEVERELNRVRGDINRLTGEIKRWDNLVFLSTIEVYLNEVEIKNSQIQFIDQSIWTKAKNGFIQTTNSLIKFSENTFVSSISYLPVLIFLGILMIVVYFIYRRVKRKFKS
jgi:hypothetical protein